MADNETYTQTGDSFFTSLGNKLSVIPFGVGAVLATVPLAIGVVWDTGKQLLKGNFGSAATELVAGTVSAGLNTFSAPVWWLGQLGSAGFTQHTIGTHARKVTESVIGAVTGALGMKPVVLSSHMAGIGAQPGAGNYYAQKEGPGYWTTRAAQQQGVDPAQRFAQYTKGEGREHVEALRNAAQTGPQQRSA